METVRHYDFTKLLADEIKNASGTLQIALRCGGGPQAANITVIVGGNKKEWFVGHNGSRSRSDTWNLVGWIRQALSIENFDDPTHNVYEDAINCHKPGWVVLTVTASAPDKAAYCLTI